uniref:Nuclear inhibitor of protein phosphatase 1-like n=1 Tax=Ciona intestinalis TaxID=7719 RepID=F6Z3Y4_CIOIN|nr:nuclear inhibitor of protein phosphatase 1-like [Ciona intestinalis]|eukprot:XP_002125657.1 nuclear inhibitor of protein phosphatase 1-like [Ciona intestinalis]
MSKRKLIEPKTKFEIPSWAGLAPSGTHLNVMKGDKLVEKLLIDEKRCYYFGRNSESCDFMIEHASCSRVHAVLLYHKHLKRMFICDLGSMHGSFIRNLRLEGNKPTPIPFDATFHFGASTRYYILKERPQVSVQDPKKEETKHDLPMQEDELDNLTEFNTAHNKRVAALPVDETNIKFQKRKRKSVVFAEEEEIINLEDVDSSVGRFRNMISVQVIPNKRQRGDTSGFLSPSSGQKKHVQEFYNQGLYEDLEDKKSTLDSSLSRLVGFVPNLAPEVEVNQSDVPIQTSLVVERPQVETSVELKPRKKYTKEAWPGKRPAPSLLV